MNFALGQLDEGSLSDAIFCVPSLEEFATTVQKFLLWLGVLEIPRTGKAHMGLHAP